MALVGLKQKVFLGVFCTSIPDVLFRRCCSVLGLHLFATLFRLAKLIHEGFSTWFPLLCYKGQAKVTIQTDEYVEHCFI